MRLNVLSLFDGMSCGRIALDRIGIEVDKYYSSEIDEYALKVANKNYPQDIANRLGDIRFITDEDLRSIGKIDLLIGGSPCQSFSFSGKREGMVTFENVEILSLEQYMKLKNNNFNFKGQSYLFWEYMRVLSIIKKYNPNIIFLLENVKMSEKWKNVLSNAIGVEPIMIDSALVSAQTRKRLYWTNIANITQPEDKNIFIKDIIDSNFECRAPVNNDTNRLYTKNYLQCDPNKTNNRSQSGRAYYLSGKHGTLDTFGLSKILGLDNRVRMASVSEVERLQTVPVGYCKGVSDKEAKKMLGNGWTVDVIAHIFKNLKDL